MEYYLSVYRYSGALAVDRYTTVGHEEHTAFYILYVKSEKEHISVKRRHISPNIHCVSPQKTKSVTVAIIYDIARTFEITFFKFLFIGLLFYYN